MTDKSTADIYQNIFEQFVELANQQLDGADLGTVSDALMQASARFCAFYVASSSEDRKALKEDKDSSVHTLGGEYKARLADHLDDYIENYKIYMRDHDAS